MNLVGKIFVVLIMIASTAFMMMGLMVYAAHRNFEAEITNTKAKDGRSGWREQLENVRKESADLQAQIQKYDERLSLEKASHRQALVKAENERDVQAKRAVDLAKEVKDQAVRLEAATKALAVSQTNLTDLRKEGATLRDDIRDANKKTDEQLKIATETLDNLHIKLGQLADLKQRNEQLASDFAKANAMLKKFNVSYLDPLNGEPPMIRGQILAIDKDDRVEISLGTDDGLREGHTLEVYRGNKYLGRMQVEKAQPHRSIGPILKEYKQEAIRKDDEVATKLRA